jgi:hypothetical protein
MYIYVRVRFLPLYSSTGFNKKGFNMSNLSLEVTLRGGDKKVFPLSFRASEYHQAGSWHEYLMPCMDRIAEVHLEMFTGDYAAWETVSYHYGEGVATKGEVEAEDFEEDKGYQYAWQMLLDGKPASYAEVDQSLNCDFWLLIKSSRQTEGDWTSIPLHKTENGLDISDGIYEAVEVDSENGTEEDGTHYGQVLEAIEPILKRQVDFVKATIDGINYEFSLSRCAE